MNAQTALRRPTAEQGFQYMQSIVMALVLMLMTVQLANGDDHSREKSTLTGNWVVTVTRIDPPPGLAPTFLSLQTYFEENLFLEESNTNLIRSSARGEWVKTGHRDFSRSFLFFRFDASRNFIGTARNAATITLSDDGQTFEAAATLQLFDAAGNLLSTSQATELGQRQ